MKRIGVLVSVAALFLACVVPAGAYQWNGESFLDDYYGAMPLAMEFDSGSFSFSGVKGAHIVYSGSFKQSFDFTSFSFLNVASPYYISCYDDFTHGSVLSFSDSVMGDSSKMYPIKWTRGIKKDLGSGHEKGGDVPPKWTEIRIAKPRDGQLWYTGKRGRDIDGAQTQAQQLWPI